MRKTSVRRDATAFSALVHFVAIGITVFVMQKGFQGVCIATSISLASRFVIANILVWCIEREENGVNARFFSSDTFRDLWPQFKLGIQSMGMSVWGYWALDIFTLMASYLSIEAIAAQTIMRSLGLYTYMLPVGLSTTASTLIGNSIGAESKLAINHYFKILMTLAVLIGVFECLLLHVTKDLIINFFADEPEVQKQMSKIWWIFQLFVIVDSISSVAANCVRATGRQNLGCIMTFVTFFIIGLPVAFCLAFLELNSHLTGLAGI